MEKIMPGPQLGHPSALHWYLDRCMRKCPRSLTLAPACCIISRFVIVWFVLLGSLSTMPVLRIATATRYLSFPNYSCPCLQTVPMVPRLPSESWAESQHRSIFLPRHMVSQNIRDRLRVQHLEIRLTPRCLFCPLEVELKQQASERQHNLRNS